MESLGKEHPEKYKEWSIKACDLVQVVHIRQVQPVFLNRVCEFHITRHLLCWALEGVATNSLPHVHYMDISYSC